MKKQLRDYIQVVENVLDPKCCTRIVRVLNKLDIWEPTKVGEAHINRDVRKCDTTDISNARLLHGELQEADALLFEAAGKALYEYKERVKAEVDIDIQMDTGYDALRYKKGGFYTTHVDHFSIRHRTVSCSFALNDDYEGGEWGFFGEEIKIKAPVGSAVLFPSNFCFPHQILPVTKGTRYSVVTWFI